MVEETAEGHNCHVVVAPGQGGTGGGTVTEVDTCV